MNDPTRRRLLVGCGAGLSALAGCSSLPWSDAGNDERRSYDRDALVRAVADADSVLPPDAFPISIPAALQHRHRDRGREYVDRVPEQPSIPNEAIATKIGDQRTEALDALEDDASGRPRNRLETWRDRRVEAATVRGSYLAATDEVGRDDIDDARGRVRSNLAAFERDWGYLAPDPVTAVVVHETLERYVDECRRQLSSHSSFPSDPDDAVFEIGEIIGNLEGANASVVDADRLRRVFLDDASDQRSYQSTLNAVSNRLRSSLYRTTSDVSDYVEGGPSVFDRDLDGTTAGRLFEEAARAVEWREDLSEEARRNHTPATAVVETGRALVAAEALDAVVRAIESGRYQDRPAVENVESAKERTVDALEAAWDATPQPLAVELARPAYDALHGITHLVEEGYARPERVVARLVYAEATALTVPAATEFVAERLRSGEVA